jgi:hypothetical protein
MALKDHFQFEEALALFEQLKTENPTSLSVGQIGLCAASWFAPKPPSRHTNIAEARSDSRRSGAP